MKTVGRAGFRGASVGTAVWGGASGILIWAESGRVRRAVARRSARRMVETIALLKVVVIRRRAAAGCAMPTSENPDMGDHDLWGETGDGG